MPISKSAAASEALRCLNRHHDERAAWRQWDAWCGRTGSGLKRADNRDAVWQSALRKPRLRRHEVSEVLEDWLGDWMSWEHWPAGPHGRDLKKLARLILERQIRRGWTRFQMALGNDGRSYAQGHPGGRSGSAITGHWSWWTRC